MIYDIWFMIVMMMVMMMMLYDGVGDGDGDDGDHHDTRCMMRDAWCMM